MNIGKVQKQVILFLAGFVLGVLYIYMIGCRETDFLGIQSLMQISFLESGYAHSAVIPTLTSRRSVASCRYRDVFWNEYWWYAVCHDPAIWLERNFAEPELLSAAGSVLYSGGQYGNQPAGSPGRAEERQNAGISYGRKKEK